LGVGLTTLPCIKKIVDKPQKIQPDFMEEAKAGLWSQGKKKKTLLSFYIKPALNV
jgi:hypothetical protein